MNVKKFQLQIIYGHEISMSKTKFNHLLLSITFNDNFWTSQLDILYFSV